MAQIGSGQLSKDGQREARRVLRAWEEEARGGRPRRKPSRAERHSVALLAGIKVEKVPASR